MRDGRRSFWVLVLVAFGLLACDRPAGQKTLVVGGILSTTGAAAAYGSDTDRGVRLAVQQIDAAGGTKLKYVLMDDKSDKTEAAKAARALVDMDRPSVILGPAISPSALTVAALAEERKIPMVVTSATQDEVTDSAQGSRRFSFRVCFNDSYQGLALASFAVKSLGKKKAAIVYDKSLSYSTGLARTFGEALAKLGGSVVAEENYSTKDTDYSALVDKVAGLDAEVVFIPGWDENVGPMLKQSGQKWSRFVLLGGDGWPTAKLLELAAGNVGNSYAIAHYTPEDPDPQVQAFRAAYKAKYGDDPSPFAALGYDAMMLIWDAAKRASSQSGQDLRAALAASHDVKLTTGTLRFGAHNNPEKDVIMVKIEPRRFVFHARFRP